MPNGNYYDTDNQFPQYETYFQSIGATLKEFAHKHNLLIEKYYHEAPVWSLCFSHPSGGSAKLDVFMISEKFVELSPVWWVDDYKAFKRNLKWGEKKKIPKENAALKKQLGEVLSTMINWKIGQWSDVADGFEEIWGRYSKKEFKAMTPKWPRPKP